MTQNQIILAISIKARRLGIAILDDKHLLFYQMINLGNSRKERFAIAEAKVRNLINIYHPNVLAIQSLILIPQRTTFFQQLTETIIKSAENYRFLSIKTYLLNKVRTYYCQQEKPTNENVARFLAGQYPELKKFIENNSRWQKFYAMLILNAVALGLYCADDISNSPK